MSNVADQLAPELVSTVTNALNDYGSDVLIQYKGQAGGTFDVASGTVTGPSQPSDATVKALIEDKGIYMGAELGTIGERKLTISASGITKPKPGDVFEAPKGSGEFYTILNKGVLAGKGVVTIYCGSTPVLYEIYGNKGK
jgi:hypothetical protein